MRVKLVNRVMIKMRKILIYLVIIIFGTCSTSVILIFHLGEIPTHLPQSYKYENILEHEKFEIKFLDTTKANELVNKSVDIGFSRSGIAGNYENTGDFEERTFTGQDCNIYTVLPTKYIASVWAVFEQKSDSVRKLFLVYKVYFDDRDATNPCLRILAAGTKTAQNASVFITLWYDGKPTVSRYFVIYDNTSKDISATYRDITYRNLLVTFPLAKFKTIATLTNVSLSSLKCDLDMTVPVVYPERNFVREFGACGSPWYDFVGGRDATAMVEWIEYYKLLGVQNFHIPQTSLTMDHDMTKVWNYYQAEGTLEVIDFPVPIERYVGDKTYELKKSIEKVSHSSCLLRNMHRYKYIVFIDLDDFIMLYNNHTLHSLMATFDAKNMFAVSKLPSFDYFLEYGPQVNFNDPLISSKYLQHSGMGNIKNKTKEKPIINVSKCVFAVQHGCTLNIRGSFSGQRVPATEASVAHYRRSCSSHYKLDERGEKRTDGNKVGVCEEIIKKGGVRNDRMLEHRLKLIQEVTRVMSILGLSDNLHY